MNILLLCLSCKLKPIIGAYFFFSALAFQVVLIKKLKTKFDFKYFIIPVFKSKKSLDNDLKKELKKELFREEILKQELKEELKNDS